MSGPYPPPGYQRPPEDNGWSAGQQQGQYEFPSVQYSGLASTPGWPDGQPPRPKRSIGRTVVAVVSSLIIVGGVVTGIVLVTHRHEERQAAQQQAASIGPSVGPSILSTQDNPPTSVDEDNPGVPNGSTSLNLTEGACVSADVGADEQYTAIHQVACGSAQSDLVLAAVAPDMAGCAALQYLRITSPTSGVYCFTLDLKQGDCVDQNYLKTACAGASFVVLETEAGPGTNSSCASTAGATHWVPIGRDPVKVGCLGPPATS